MTFSKKYSHKVFFVALLFIVLLGCSREQKHVITGETMGTYYQLTIVSDDVNQGEVQALVDKRLNELNLSMSTYISDSEISRFNDSGSMDWTNISKDMYFVIAERLIASIETQGAFDITVGPLIERWGFGRLQDLEDSPSKVEIDSIMKYVGYDLINISLDSTSIKKLNPKTQINLSANAKGYAVDQISHLLSEKGYINHLVDIGGEMKSSGLALNSKQWVVAIEKPLDYSRGIIHKKISLTNKGIATSGDYRNFHEVNGKKFSHTINPKTGESLYHQLASVSVVSETAMEADAMATALMVMGDEVGFEYALENDLAVLMIVRDGESFKTLITPLMGDYLLK